MAIIDTITDGYHFWYWLKNSDSYTDNFTQQGAWALQDYLDELSTSTDEDIEFDPIAWCVQYTEWENIKEFNKQQGTEFSTWDEVADNTQVIELNDGAAVVADY